MVKWLKIFPFLVLFFLASCNAEQQRVIEMKTEVVDGLQFGVPEGRKVETGADHILLLPEQALREVDEIAIWTTAPQPVAGGVDTEGTDPAPHTFDDSRRWHGRPGIHPHHSQTNCRPSGLCPRLYPVGRRNTGVRRSVAGLGKPGGAGVTDRVSLRSEGGALHTPQLARNEYFCARFLTSVAFCTS